MISYKFLAVAVAGSLIGTAPSLARPRYLPYPADVPPPIQIGVPFYSREIGIPGPNRVCVKECRRDSSPCDPPEYKQADGRCNFLF